MMLRNIPAFVIVLFPSIAFAVPAAIVEGMQMPVFIEHVSQLRPLEPGMELQTGDRLLTGDGARVLLRLADGSLVKLGENAEFNVDSIAVPEKREETFKAAFMVIKGAFRFTTGLISRYKNRDVTTQIRTLTVGIRGTDVWGKSEPDRDFVVLLEGQITIQRNNEPQQSMTEAMSLFMAPRGEPALPVTPVDPDDLAIWAQETELQENQGVMREDGQWVLNLASYHRIEIAEGMQATLIDRGFPAGIIQVNLDGRDWHRLVIRGFSTVSDGRTMGQQLSEQFGFTSPWVGPE
ncbi:MAG: FecR domain-containing protein [Thiotrichales bacterium]|nr:FecR domain-containing protein [Thiotrichales bacterium]